MLPGSYDDSYNGSTEIFIAKFSPDLKTLLAVTFLGGSSSDWGNALAIAPNGDVFVTGGTSDGSVFPTTTGAYQTSDQWNATNTFASYIARLDANLGQLKSSTLFDRKRQRISPLAAY